MSISADSSNDNLILKLEKYIFKLSNLVEKFKLDKVPPSKAKYDVTKSLILSFLLIISI